MVRLTQYWASQHGLDYNYSNLRQEHEAKHTIIKLSGILITEAIGILVHISPYHKSYNLEEQNVNLYVTYRPQNNAVEWSYSQRHGQIRRQRARHNGYPKRGHWHNTTSSQHLLIKIKHDHTTMVNKLHMSKWRRNILQMVTADDRFKYIPINNSRGNYVGTVLTSAVMVNPWQAIWINSIKLAR